MVDEDTKEIIASFVAEGFERLDDAEAQLSRLGGGEEMEIFGCVFRLFHSVKGSAGFLNFENVKILTHEAETLLEIFLKECIMYTPDSLDILLETVDLLREMIQGIEKTFNDDMFTDRVRSQAKNIRGCIDMLRNNNRVGIEEDSRYEIVLNEIVTRDMVERFLTETLDLLDSAEKMTLELEKNKNNGEAIHDIFRVIHSVKGNAGFFGCEALEKLCMTLENDLDAARKKKVRISEQFINTALKKIDSLRMTVRTLHVSEKGAGSGTPQEKAYKPLGEILVEIGAVDGEALHKALDVQERPIGEILVEAGSASTDDISRALNIQKTLKQPESGCTEEIQRKEIRVDTSKLDKLFDLVGELITAEAMLINSPDLLGLKLDSFRKSYAALNKITRELQETTMMIRMIPLEGLFNKMTRLVRDLSRKFGKEVDLRIIGGETEMDKNVIEQVSDPLVHIIRNAIDHGLESAAERRAAGKNEKGSLRIEARHEGSEIRISVKDDGRGLNREKILAKAASRGLLQGDGADLPDRDVWNFIFEPGFSTADTVSDISGRGVGMDVVSKNIEKIRGRVEILSEAGRGSELILRIPLTMAIIDAITVRVGENHYSIPQGDIVEFFRAVPDQITRLDVEKDVVNLRGDILPLLKLYEVFDVEPKARNPEEGTSIVLANNGRKCCLLVDEVVGNQQIVIKSLSEYLGEVDGLSGCTIMGDGTVSFIVDSACLMSLRLD